MKTSNTICFNPDGKLTILQISDPQDLIYVRKAMVQMLDAAYDKVRPDLVIFTGDNVLGNHLLDARFGNRKVASGKEATYHRLKASLSKILDPLEKRQIPFAMIFGNHDDMNDITKDEHIEIYRKYENCLPMNTDNCDVDCDTYIIPVFSSDKKNRVLNFWMLDSAWYDHSQKKCFEEIKQETVKWYNSEYKKIIKESGNVPSLLFLHIPLPQQKEFFVPCSKSEPGAIKIDNKYIRLDNNKAFGFAGEPASVCKDEYGLFESIKKNGDVMAVVSGHDHSNNFDGIVDGVRMIQSSAASFRCYGGDVRGVRVFKFDENNIENFETYTLRFWDLCGKTFVSKLRYIWDADDKLTSKIAFISSISVIVGIVISFLLKKK